MMERERERERVQDHAWDEARALDHQQRRKLLSERSLVVKYDDAPWEQSQSAYHKVFTGESIALIERKPWLAPMTMMRTLIQTVDTGHKNANHRHYTEVPFFIIEGKGHEVHDGRRFDWEAGDLMLVPPYCFHQHFCDQGPARLFYIQGTPGGINGRELTELNENYVLPEDGRPLYDEQGKLIGYRRPDGTEIFFSYNPYKAAMAGRTLENPPEPSHEVTDSYEYYIRLFEEERHWRQAVPQVIKQADRKWEDTRNGRILWFLHPQHPPLQTGLRMYEIYLQELPPGGRSGKHSHVGEEVHFIIEGRGYDEINGKRWEWDQNDVVAIPLLSTHQSFNVDSRRPARFLVVKSRLYEYLSFGGVEHMEDAWP